MRRVPGVTTTTLQHAVSGTYQTEQINVSADLTAGTEWELAVMAANILANTDSKDEVFSWIRLTMVSYDTAQGIVFEWFVVRCLITDALQDMDDEGVVEALQKDNRILRRGFYRTGSPLYTNAPILDEEFHKVRLRYGEELRFIVNPIYCGAAQFFQGRLEWRQQGK